jgi:hypothetical protein
MHRYKKRTCIYCIIFVLMNKEYKFSQKSIIIKFDQIYRRKYKHLKYSINTLQDIFYGRSTDINYIIIVYILSTTLVKLWRHWHFWLNIYGLFIETGGVCKYSFEYYFIFSKMWFQHLWRDYFNPLLLYLYPSKICIILINERLKRRTR